jgi:hypothetical protein
MTTMAFDTLSYARRLREAGVPEPQANVQAELMAEAFGFYADNLLTKDYFHEVLNARFAEQDARFDARFNAQEARFEARFARQDRILMLHTWMLGLITLVLVVPQLQVWLA